MEEMFLKVLREQKRGQRSCDETKKLHESCFIVILFKEMYLILKGYSGESLIHLTQPDTE